MHRAPVRRTLIPDGRRPRQRLELGFLWPSLVPPDPAAKPALAEDASALDRIFLSIAAAQGTVPPAERIKAIYRRYLADEQFAGPDELLIVSFRDGTPYQG